MAVDSAHRETIVIPEQCRDKRRHVPAGSTKGKKQHKEMALLKMSESSL